jgi:hypothetical protein
MAYEKENSSFINKTSALENCETSAVGRALAILGFEIKKSVASYEEVANAKLNQNNDTQEELANSKQVGLIKVIVKSIGMVKKVPELEVLQKALGKEDEVTYDILTTLTKTQASELIKKLQKWQSTAEQQTVVK